MGFYLFESRVNVLQLLLHGGQRFELLTTLLRPPEGRVLLCLDLLLRFWQGHPRWCHWLTMVMERFNLINLVDGLLSFSIGRAFCFLFPPSFSFTLVPGLLLLVSFFISGLGDIFFICRYLYWRLLLSFHPSLSGLLCTPSL